MGAALLCTACIALRAVKRVTASYVAPVEGTEPDPLATLFQEAMPLLSSSSSPRQWNTASMPGFYAGDDGFGSGMSVGWRRSRAPDRTHCALVAGFHAADGRDKQQPQAEEGGMHAELQHVACKGPLINPSVWKGGE